MYPAVYIEEEYQQWLNSLGEDDTSAVPSKTIPVPPRSPNTSAAAVPENEIPFEEELILERVI